MSPLEKSLVLRLSKAQQLYDWLSAQGTYSHKFSAESLDETRMIIESINLLQERYSTDGLAFQQLSARRQELFGGRSNSIKSISSAILDAVSERHPAKTAPYQLVHLVLAKMKAQNPLPAPEDFYTPTIQKELQPYERSYVVLMEHFQLLITTLELIHFEATDPLLHFHQLRSLQAQARQLSEEVHLAKQKLLALNEERMQLFRDLKRRVDAVITRSRHLYGATDPRYLTVKKYKL